MHTLDQTTDALPPTGLEMLRDTTALTFAVACAWCNRWKTENGWQMAPPGPLNPRQISHGICPDCFEKQRAA